METIKNVGSWLMNNEDSITKNWNWDETDRNRPAVLNYFKTNSLIPFVYMAALWDENEVATVYNLKYKKKWKYVGGDTEKLYLKNLETRPNNWYYRNNEVTYTVNSYGYRTKEFNDIDWKESIVMFGCSNTFCTAVNDNHTVSYFLEKLTGRPVINMGIPGSNVFTTYYTSLSIKTKFPTPFAVLMNFTSLDRFSIIEEYMISLYGSWNMHLCPEINLSEKSSIKHDTVLRNILYAKMIEEMWEGKCKYYQYTPFPDTESILSTSQKIDLINYYGCIDWARDFNHMGPKGNLTMAKTLAVKLQNMNEPN